MPSESYALDQVQAKAEALDDLLRRAQGGEEGAFEEIMHRFEGRALAIAHQLGASRADAEDIAQEAFLKLFRHIHAYRGGRRFTAYFYRIVLNAARDYRSRMGPRAEPPDDPSAEGGPSGAAGGAERREEVRQALLQLSEREREVVVLRQLHGLSTWEVARALGLNPVTVRRHWMRARARLQELLRL
jgi:RNA polymerase sigma-70 factor (ECF subfamily)